MTVANPAFPGEDGIMPNSTGTDAPRNEAGLPIGVLVLLGAVLFGVFRQGAYHDWQLEIFSYAVLAAGAALAISRQRIVLLYAGAIAAPLLLSSAISTAVSADASDARSTFLVIGLTAVGLAAGFAVPRERRPLAIDAIMLAAALVAITAIWGVAHQQPKWGRITEGVWRGSSSLTYANAAASVLGPLTLLALRRLSARSSTVGTMAATLFAIGFATTQSRAGALAVAVVGLALIVRIGPSRFARAALPVAAGFAIGAPALLALSPDTETARPALSLALAVVGVAAAGGLAPITERLARPGTIFAGLTALALVVALVTGLTDPLTSRLTLDSTTTAGGPTEQVRFGDRGREWQAGWERFTAEPIFGNGPGVVELRWSQDGRGYRAWFVHNEYLEFAVTNGAFGLAALLLSATLLLLLVRRHRDPDAQPEDAVLPSAVGFAVATFALHSGFDFLWHLAVLPVLFAFLAGLSARTTIGENFLRFPTDTPDIGS